VTASNDQRLRHGVGPRLCFQPLGMSGVIGPRFRRGDLDMGTGTGSCAGSGRPTITNILGTPPTPVSVVPRAPTSPTLLVTEDDSASRRAQVGRRTPRPFR
jgi:hypothetical protein